MARDATTVRVSSPAFQAYRILHIAFTIVPLVAGVDKFFDVLVNWPVYLSPIVPHVLGWSGAAFMRGVGVIEIIAGLIVAAVPRVGGWIVGLWLCAIIVNLLSIPAYFDIALRDAGLALGAFALARLADEYSSV